MVRIAGFHPADPGSIPGDEDCLGTTLKATSQPALTRKEWNGGTNIQRGPTGFENKSLEAR